MTDVGQGWLMSSLTPSPLLVSLLLTAESLPFFVFGLPAGALADVVDRRRLLIVTQLAMAVMIGALATVALIGVVAPWMLLALAFALGIATAFNDPAWQATIPEFLPKEELAAGITLSGVGVNVARTLGPALGGIIVAGAGPAIVFVLDGLSFLCVIGVLLAWRRQPTRSTLPPAHMLPAIRAGLRFVRNSLPLRRVLFSTFLFMVCGAGVMTLMPVLGRETGYGAVGYGLLLGSIGADVFVEASGQPHTVKRICVRLKPPHRPSADILPHISRMHRHNVGSDPSCVCDILPHRHHRCPRKLHRVVRQIENRDS
jgi:MFS family permease